MRQLWCREDNMDNIARLGLCAVRQNDTCNETLWWRKVVANVACNEHRWQWTLRDDQDGFRRLNPRVNEYSLKILVTWHSKVLQLGQKNMTHAVWAHFFIESLQIKSCYEGFCLISLFNECQPMELQSTLSNPNHYKWSTARSAGPWLSVHTHLTLNSWDVVTKEFLTKQYWWSVWRYHLRTSELKHWRNRERESLRSTTGRERRLLSANLYLILLHK
jgi:hypothetical protein